MAAATMIMSQTATITRPSQASKPRFSGASARMMLPMLITFRARHWKRRNIRCVVAQKDNNLSGLSEAVNRAMAEILWHQENDDETGSKSFFNAFAFDGALAETINGRLAMVGIAWAFFAEMATGLTVWEQLDFLPGQTGLLFLLCAVQLVPIVNGELMDPRMDNARRFGPFTAEAERWTGRVAMIAFAALLVTEAFRHAPVFHCATIMSILETCAN